MINGNKLDQSIEAAANASNTDYILVQTWTGLSPLDQQNLYNEGCSGPGLCLQKYIFMQL